MHDRGADHANPGRFARPLLRMLRYVQPHLRLMMASTALRVVNLALGVLLLGLSGKMVAAAVIRGAVPDLSAWIVLIVVGATKAVARYAEQVSGHVAAFRILDALRGELYDGFASKGVEERSGERSGDIVSRAMADVELVEVYFAHTLAPLVAAMLFVAAAGAAAWTIAGAAGGALVLFMLIAASVVVPVAFQQLGLAHGMQTRECAGALSAEIGEAVAGIQDLVSAGALDRESARLQELGRRYAAQTAALTRLGAVKAALVDLLLVGSLVVTAWLGLLPGSTTGAGPGTDPALVWAVIAGLAGGFGAVLAVSRAVDDLPKSAAAAVRILEVVGDRAPAQPDPPRGGSHSTRCSIAPTPELRVDSVGYRYASGNGVSGVSFQLAPGEHLYVTGPSGSGKSTLASLVLRLLEPQEGTITLDATDAARLEEACYRRLVSAALQDPRLIRGTVEENLLVGLPVEHDRDATRCFARRLDHPTFPRAAVEVPDLEALFDDLPEAEQTLAGGADEQISGGQKKRLSLARMIARDPRIIVLDEAFAGLDPDLRSRVRASLLTWAAGGRRSILEFSHELSDAADADRVLVLHHGHVVQSGTYAELSEADGLFSRLLRAGITDRL